MKMRNFTRMIAGKECQCVEAVRNGYMRLKLFGSFGDAGYDVVDLMLIPIDMPDEAITILSDYWLTEKEKELGLPVGCSCTSNSWWAGHADDNCDYLLTGKYNGLITKVIQYMNSAENGDMSYQKLHIYFDKFGIQIQAGMTIRHCNGERELVYATQDSCGADDLGISALTEAWKKKHPDCDEEFYPLSSLDLSEWWAEPF